MNRLVLGNGILDRTSDKLLDGGPERLSPRAVKGSGADQAEQFMGAKRTPLTALAGHRRTIGRQGQSTPVPVRSSEATRRGSEIVLNRLARLARLTSPDAGQFRAFAQASPARLVERGPPRITGLLRFYRLARLG